MNGRKAGRKKNTNVKYEYINVKGELFGKIFEVSGRKEFGIPVCSMKLYSGDPDAVSAISNHDHRTID